MSSFYGMGVSFAEAKKMQEESNNHIIVSKTEPTVQKAGDLWFVIVSDDKDDEDEGDKDNG